MNVTIEELETGDDVTVRARDTGVRTKPFTLRTDNPCRDYDSDCEEMTLKQIEACHRSPGEDDDHCGYCVMKHRCN